MSRRLEGPDDGGQETAEEGPMTEEKSAATESLRKFCQALIEELATLGGEESLFSHMKEAVEIAATKGDLPALRETWEDLKVWTRGLTSVQRVHVARHMWEKFGMTLACDDDSAHRDMHIPDPPDRPENEHS